MFLKSKAAKRLWKGRLLLGLRYTILAVLQAVRRLPVERDIGLPLRLQLVEPLDRDVKRANENPSVGVLLCKSADHSTVEYALSRTMSPALVAEYKRVMIPREVLQETFDRYLENGGAG